MAFLLGRSTRGGGGHCFCLICGGRWQIPQDWAKTWRPNFCVAVNPSSVPACCADAPPAASTPKRMAERTAALRFIWILPTFAFLQAYAGTAASGRLDPERGGLTGMRFGRAAISGCGQTTDVSIFPLVP